MHIVILSVELEKQVAISNIEDMKDKLKQNKLNNDIVLKDKESELHELDAQIDEIDNAAKQKFIQKLRKQQLLGNLKYCKAYIYL